MTEPIPSPRLLDCVPHDVTKGEINIAHAPPSSLVRAIEALVANLFGNFHGFTQNKRVSAPRDTTGLTPARKKHGNTMQRASSLKARSAIQEVLSAELSSLHINDLFHVCAELSDLHWTMIVTPDGNDNNDGLLDESDNDDSHPKSTVIPTPKQQKKKVLNRSSNPKLVLDRNFMWFLEPDTFDNQPFRKEKQEMYIADMDCFDADYTQK
jgi:hypothetical protein